MSNIRSPDQYFWFKSSIYIKRQEFNKLSILKGILFRIFHLSAFKSLKSFSNRIPIFF
ncbi:hypothetical protein LEP1GSC051_2355 [Leptospira sp. P2653]|nr:hypothetical protein LEP1GSC051_2355 [Leptospira sp. P2653]